MRIIDNIDNRREVAISNDPVSGLQRKVKISNTDMNWRYSYVQLDLEVFYLDAQGNDVANDKEGLNKNGRFNSLKVKLIASSELVDPATGDESTADNAITEFEYFSNMTPTDLGLDANTGLLAILDAVFDAQIAIADGKGKFD
jgi:hypothetical protein